MGPWPENDGFIESDTYAAMWLIARIWRESSEYEEFQKDTGSAWQYTDYLDAIDAGYGEQVADALRCENARLNEDLL